MRKYLVSLSLVLFSGSSFAGSGPAGNISDFVGGGGEIGSWLGDAVYKLQYPVDVEIQGSKFYYAGGVYLRTPKRMYQPFNIQPPRISMGCGGIDITFGAFGYLKPEYLVEFGKNVLENAPAFAFKTAIEVFCPTCEDIMTKLENLANLLNSMQLDSCSFAQAVSGYVRDKLKSSVASKDSESGKTDFYLDKLNAMNEGAKNILDSFVARGLERSEVVRVINQIKDTKDQISIVRDVMPELKSGSTYKLGSSPLIEDSSFRDAMVALFGDVEVQVPGGDKAEIAVYAVPPCSEAPDTTAQVVTLAVTGQATLCGSDVSLTMGGKNIYEAVREFTDEIVQRVQGRQPLDPVHLQFLGMFPFPAYRMINTLSVYPAALQQFGDTLAEYFAYELVKLLLLEHMRAYTHTLVALKNSDMLRDNGSAQNTIAYALTAGNNNLSSAVESISVLQKEIERKITNGIKMVQAYEREVAKLLGGDPAYQAVIWSQVSAVRSR